MNLSTNESQALINLDQWELRYYDCPQTCGETVYAGLVKAGESWHDVMTGRPAEWSSWESEASDEAYSDCAKLDINTGQYSQALSSFKLYINSKVRGKLLKGGYLTIHVTKIKLKSHPWK